MRASRLSGVVFRTLRGLEGASHIFLAKSANRLSPAAKPFTEFGRARPGNER